MDNLELENILDILFKSDLNMFYTVLSANDVLNIKIKNFPAAYIVNTEPSNKRGSHWVCFYFAKDSYPEFFYSLGESPAFYDLDFQTFLLRNGKCFIHNVKRIQSYGSSLCGLYAVYFIWHRFMKESFEKILGHFSDNLDKNDNIIQSEFRDKFIIRL